MSALEGEGSLIAALEAVDWEGILPQLVAYAERRLLRLGLREGRTHRPSATEVKELVNEAILRCLDGRRKWDDAKSLELVPFLCGVIRSVAWEYKKDAARCDVIDDEMSAPTNDAEINDPRVGIIEELTKEDSDIEEVYLVIAVDGITRRDEIAHRLGWNPDKVSVVRKKIQRRVEQRMKGKT